MRRIARVATEILRLTFARESLGDASAAAPPAPRPGVRFLRLLLASEPLPMDPPAPPRARGGLLRAVFAPEMLPSDPPLPPRRNRGSLLRALFALEALPRDPVPAAPRRPSRLASLFAPEKLDDSK